MGRHIAVECVLCYNIKNVKTPRLRRRYFMAVGIICIVLEALIFGYICFRIVKSKQISLKDTVVYPFLVIISAVLIAYGQARYGNFPAWWKAVPSSFSGALSLLTMKLDSGLTELFLANDYALYIGYVFAYVISAMALFSISISLFKVMVRNRLRIRFNRKELDYLFTLTEDAKTYIKNLNAEQRKQTVVILQKSYDKAYADERLFLDEQGVKFKIMPFQGEKAFSAAMRSLMRCKKAEKFYFVSFMEKEPEIYDFVTNAKRFLKANDLYDGKVQFVVSTAPSQRVYVRELIEGAPQEMVTNLKNKEVRLVDESKGCVRSYDKYGIMAFDFIRTHDLAKSFPQELLNADATIADACVNLFVLGFGKVNQALVKDVLINTQFVTKAPAKEAGKFELKPVRLNTYIFDENKSSADLQLSSGIMKYDKAVLNAEAYFELPEDYRSHIVFENEINVEGVKSFDKIRDVVFAQMGQKKPIVNYYIVSLGTDFENVAIAQKLLNNLPQGAAHNVVYVRTGNAAILKDLGTPSIIPFGDNKTVLSYDNVIADKMYSDAKVQSCVYEGKAATKENVAKEWSTLSKIKQDSNLYSVAGIPFKLSLLKASANDKKSIVAERYDPEGRRGKGKNADGDLSALEVYSYLSPSATFYPRDVLAFSEHERWLALEMSLGVTPMEKSKIETYNQNKTPNELCHACLTTARGLADYCDVMKPLKGKFAPDDAIQKKLGDADVIKYDFDVMDNYVKET